MSRKARINSEEKEGWGRIRMFVFSGGYAPVKPKPGAFCGAVAVLSDSGGKGLAGLVTHAARARSLVVGGDTARTVVVLDLEPLKRELEAASVPEERETCWDAAVEAEGAKRELLGKACLCGATS